MAINVRRAGSAHRGLSEWLLQRLSALYLGGFVLFAAGRLLWAPIVTYEAWRDWVLSLPMRLALALFFFGLLLHSWVGIRSVFMDYLKPMWLRFAAQGVTGLGLLTLGIWAMVILFGGRP